MTLVERNELEFYLQEYRPVFNNDSTLHLLKKDVNNRWRFFNIVNSDFELHADPLIGVNTYSTNNKSTIFYLVVLNYGEPLVKIKTGDTKFIIETIQRKEI